MGSLFIGSIDLYRRYNVGNEYLLQTSRRSSQ
nr:MAG TPA: hypothetical protein [Caudoviricetes sp.]